MNKHFVHAQVKPEHKQGYDKKDQEVFAAAVKSGATAEFAGKLVEHDRKQRKFVANN